MKFSRRLLFVFMLLKLMILEIGYGQNGTRNIIIVAGQSNALNWHSDASLLENSELDSSILYYYHTGLLPVSSVTNPFNSTSGEKWTTLQYQTQQPYKSLHKTFFGPEMTIARSLFPAVPQLAVIKCAYAGSTIANDWKKGNSTGYHLYELMISQINKAINLFDSSGITYTIVGFFWMQGESDAANLNYANNYEMNLTEFIHNVRTDLETPHLKFILGRIGVHLPSPYNYKEIVRQAQLKVAGNDSLVQWINTDDLQLDGDSVHFLAGGVKTLGTRMATAILSVSTSNHYSFSEIPTSFSLYQNYPNPFNPTTIIRYSIPSASRVSLTVFNILGQQIAILVNNGQPPGLYEFMWNAEMPSGIYFYRIDAVSTSDPTQRFTQLKRMLLLK